MLLRSAMRELLLLFGSATAMKSAPSITGCRWMERTFRADVRGQVCADAGRSYDDGGRDPERYWLLSRRLRAVLMIRIDSGDGP